MGEAVENSFMYNSRIWDEDFEGELYLSPLSGDLDQCRTKTLIMLLICHVVKCLDPATWVPFPAGTGKIFSLALRKYFTCSSPESNPGRWIYRQTLYHVAV